MLIRPEGITDEVWFILEGERYARRYRWITSHRLGSPHLDIGCAQGHLVAHLSAVTSAVVAVDIDAGLCATARELLRANGVGNVAVVQADAHALPFTDEAFPSASITETLEHIADPLAVLSEIRRVMQPGGQLLVTVPAEGAMANVDGHLHDFSQADIRALVKDAGFCVSHLSGEWPFTYLAARKGP